MKSVKNRFVSNCSVSDFVEQSIIYLYDEHVFDQIWFRVTDQFGNQVRLQLREQIYAIR